MQDRSPINMIGWLVLLYFGGESVAYVLTGLLSRDLGILYKAAFYAKFFPLVYYLIRVLCHMFLPAFLILSKKSKLNFLLAGLLFLVFGNTLEFNPYLHVLPDKYYTWYEEMRVLPDEAAWGWTLFCFLVLVAMFSHNRKKANDSQS